MKTKVLLLIRAASVGSSLRVNWTIEYHFSLPLDHVSALIRSLSIRAIRRLTPCIFTRSSLAFCRVSLKVLVKELEDKNAELEVRGR